MDKQSIVLRDCTIMLTRALNDIVYELESIKHILGTLHRTCRMCHEPLGSTPGNVCRQCFSQEVNVEEEF